MFPESHKLISETVHETLRTRYGVDLDLKTLRKASVSPDYHVYWRLFSHRKQYMFDIVCGRTARLKRDIAEGVHPKKIAKKLGILFHFICDFFTASHNHLKKNQWYKHYTYEKNLDAYIIENIPVRHNFSESRDSNFSVKQYIDNAHALYLKNETSFSIDLIFSLNVSIGLCLFLFDINIV